MKYLARTFSVVAVIVSVVIVEGTAGIRQERRKMKGQIIAYRPAERASQVVSHALNKESFLFRVSTSESNSRDIVVKLVYEHFGYSELGDDVLSKTAMLQLSVRRDAACDETYNTFVQSAPVLNEDQTKRDANEKVVFIGPFQKMKLSPDQPLKCYKLRSGNLRIDASRPSH